MRERSRKSSPNRIVLSSNKMKALLLRVEGHPYREIAARLDVKPPMANYFVNDAIRIILRARECEARLAQNIP